MSTTVHTRRTQADWDQLAQDTILPTLQAGTPIRELAKKYNNGNVNAIRAALGRIGYSTKGEPLANKPIEAKTDKALANQVAKRRQAGEPWWKIAAAAGKSEARLKVLLAEHRHPASGNGSEPEPEAS